MRKIFITGTDTGIGKTKISCLLIKQLHGQGYTVAGFKPVACGLDLGQSAQVDALALQAASSIDLPIELVNPVCLTAASAPTIAAQLDNTSIDLSDLLAHFGRLERHLETHSKPPMAIVSEGVGGWDVPLNGQATTADLACQLADEIVLVVGLRLGCLNHARLSAQTILQHLTERSLPAKTLRGYVINCVDPSTDHQTAYIQALQETLSIPYLGLVSYNGDEPIAI